MTNFTYWNSNELINKIFKEDLPHDKENNFDLPWPEINSITGGIFPTSFIVIGADTGRGKSLILGDIAIHASEQGKKVLYFDFENDDGDFIMRQVANKVARSIGRVFTVKDLRKDFNSPHMVDTTRDALIEVKKKIKNIKLYKNDRLPTSKEFSSQLENTDDFDLVLIDHLHYFSFEGTSQNISDQISTIMRSLRTLTKKRIPIVIASHFKRRDPKKDPTLDDLFGSSNIAKEAKTVILLGERIDDPTTTTFHIQKNRDGGLATVDAKFNRVGNYFDFEDGRMPATNEQLSF